MRSTVSYVFWRSTQHTKRNTPALCPISCSLRTTNIMFVVKRSSPLVTVLWPHSKRYVSWQPLERVPHPRVIRARCRGSFTLRLTAFLVEYGNDCVFPLLWDFSLATREGDKSMELQQDDPVLLKSELYQLNRKAVWPHCFRVCHCLHRCCNLLFSGLDPDGPRDWLLR